MLYKISLCLAVCGILLGGFQAAGAPAQPEDELKAAIVLGFLHYTEWSQPLQPGAPIVVRVYGRPAFAQALRRSVEGKLVNGHAIRVAELKTAADLHDSRIVYFATGRADEIKPLLSMPRSFAPLAIGETGSFLDWGGAVNLLVIDGRMSFEVSLDALRRSGATVSSRLLRFGQIRRTGKGDS